MIPRVRMHALQVSCFFVGMLCSACGLPPLIGHILAGMTLGPAGLNMISSLVQISSVGELGVYFILFTLGLEFEFDKLQTMWRYVGLSIEPVNQPASQRDNRHCHYPPSL